MWGDCAPHSQCLIQAALPFAGKKMNSQRLETERSLPPWFAQDYGRVNLMLATATMCQVLLPHRKLRPSAGGTEALGDYL